LTLQRWPIHPHPNDGEALSGWLYRIAQCYQMELDELLLYEWGQPWIPDLDTRPPAGFLDTIAQRSGVELDVLRCMTLAGWVPWLLDTFEIETDAFDCYVYQLSVLLPLNNTHPPNTIPRWRAWLPKETIQRACPICLNQPSGQDTYKLLWQIPLFISCPIHGCWLEPCFRGYSSRFLCWEEAKVLPRQANDAIKKMDARTEQALTYGHVELPRRKIHAGLWFRLLRTLIEELSIPIAYCGLQSGNIRKIWKNCGHPNRAGLYRWYPFEMLDLPVQLRLLEAAATAMHLIETRQIKAQGTLGHIFLPEPERVTAQGRKPALNQDPDEDTINSWSLVKDALEKAIVKARYDPETAKKLFDLVVYGKRDPKNIEETLNMFIGYGIPAEWCQK